MSNARVPKLLKHTRHPPAIEQARGCETQYVCKHSNLWNKFKICVFIKKGNEVSIVSYLTAILIVKVVWRRVDLPLTRLCDFGSSCSLWSPQEEVEVWIVVWMPLSTRGISADYSKYILKLLLLLQIITVSFCFFFLEIHFFTLKLLYVFVSD